MNSRIRVFLTVGIIVGVGLIAAGYRHFEYRTAANGPSSYTYESAPVSVSRNIRDPAPSSSTRAEQSGNAKRTDKSIPNLARPATTEEVGELKEWADDFYQNSRSAIVADRYRFVHIDWYTFYQQLELSPAYVAAITDRTPMPVHDNMQPTFRLDLFDDRSVKLLLTDVRFTGDEGSRTIHMNGKVLSGEGGYFSLSTTEGTKSLRGQIESEDLYTRLDTRKGTEITAIAQFDQKKIEAGLLPMD